MEEVAFSGHIPMLTLKKIGELIAKLENSKKGSGNHKMCFAIDSLGDTEEHNYLMLLYIMLEGRCLIFK